MVYLPTWRTQRFPQNSERSQVEARVMLEGYETALDRQTEDAKKVKITKCEADRSCGFFFSTTGKQRYISGKRIRATHMNNLFIS